MKKVSGIHLAMASSGEYVRIISVDGGQGMRKRLADLGVNLGEVILVVQTNHHGPMIISVKESRLAIGRGITHKIMVEPLRPVLE